MLDLCVYYTSYVPNTHLDRFLVRAGGRVGVWSGWYGTKNTEGYSQRLYVIGSVGAVPTHSHDVPHELAPLWGREIVCQNHRRADDAPACAKRRG